MSDDVNPVAMMVGLMNQGIKGRLPGKFRGGTNEPSPPGSNQEPLDPLNIASHAAMAAEWDAQRDKSPDRLALEAERKRRAKTPQSRGAPLGVQDFAKQYAPSGTLLGY